MLDKGLDLQVTIKNIKALQQYTRMSDVRIYYWDWTQSELDLPDKASPSDNGKDVLLNVLNNELVEYKDESEDEFII